MSPAFHVSYTARTISTFLLRHPPAQYYAIALGELELRGAEPDADPVCRLGAVASGSYSSRTALMSPAFHASKARRTISTFCRDIPRAVPIAGVKPGARSAPKRGEPKARSRDNQRPSRSTRAWGRHELFASFGHEPGHPLGAQ